MQFYTDLLIQILYTNLLYKAFKHSIKIHKVIQSILITIFQYNLQQRILFYPIIKVDTWSKKKKNPEQPWCPDNYKLLKTIKNLIN